MNGVMIILGGENMNKELKQYDINNLYKVLRKHDIEILKHYNRAEVSDNE